MPSVAISSVTPSWLTRWRSTRRSISQASTNMSAPAMTKAIRLPRNLSSMPSQSGTQPEKRAMARAANSTMAPCAKLKTPEAL
ncbi:hypothetical protein FQZ97_1216580 [compost metagenome]